MSRRADTPVRTSGRPVRPTGPGVVAGVSGFDAGRRAGPRIGLAFNRKPDEGQAPSVVPSGNGSGNPADLYAEWDDEVTIAALEAALAEVGEVTRLEASDDFPFRLREAKPDIVFNVAEGLWGPNRE